MKRWMLIASFTALSLRGDSVHALEPDGINASEEDLSVFRDQVFEDPDSLEFGGLDESYNSMPWNWNLPFKDCRTVSCGYDCNMHKGSDLFSTDWRLQCGASIYAPASGYIQFAGWKNGYGYRIEVEAGPTGQSNGWRYVYSLSHLDGIDWNVVRPGWWVFRGQYLGKSGNSGVSTGCHLHFTLHRGPLIHTGKANLVESYPISISGGIDGYDALNNRCYQSEN